MTSDARRRGRFITIEGPEGSGKTTQALRLRDALERTGIDVLLTREPGGTWVGERVREMLLATGEGSEVGPTVRDARTDALLFSAARAELVAEVIRPSLDAGMTVLCARYADSTLAYQGFGAGLDVDELRALERFATDGLRPDLTILLDLPVELGLGRKDEERTRFEVAFDLAFHDRVRRGFLALAAAEPERFAVVDARGAPDEVFRAVLDVARRIVPGLRRL